MIRSKAVPACVVILFICFVTCDVMAAPVEAATPSAGWLLRSLAEPTDFSATDTQNEVVTLTVNATDGEYELRTSRIAATTSLIAWDASASMMQEALEALPGVGVGNVSVTGGPGGSDPYTVTWTGALSGSNPGPLEVRENKLKDGIVEGKIIAETVQQPKAHDRIVLTATNVGSRSSEGIITIRDRLPAGLVPVEVEAREPLSHQPMECSSSELKCTYGQAVRVGHELLVEITVAVTSASLRGSLINRATASGGGGLEVSTSAFNLVDMGLASFGIAGFAYEADGIDGASDAQAGDHPYSVTTTIDLDTVRSAGATQYDVPQEAEDIAVDLPLGLAGDPLTAERCPEIDLTDAEGALGSGRYRTTCPASSWVGTVRIVYSGGGHPEPFPVYNVTPEYGYPAEFGFNAGLGQPIFLYASVVHGTSGYRLRVATPGALRTSHLDVESVQLTVFGDPGEVNGTSSTAAFVTNPTRCSTEPANVSAFVTSWEGGSANAEATAYPELTGCNLLQGATAFDPNLAVEPETMQADAPSGYTVDLKLPQAPGTFGALATPELKNTTVTLPAGVSISPSAASGPSALGGCAATGKEGINIGGGEVAPDGQDLGDPEATELGEGHPGGNSSPYDDGMWHTEPGHCPENSRLGEVEVKTPVLAEPLHGHVYLAAPHCAQAACTEAEAEEGKVFGLYLEVAGSGVIIKLAGSVEAGGYGAHSREAGLAPGQLRARFDENPQFPFEELKLTFPGGQRAALANPQTCGSATTTSELEPWSHKAAPGEAEGTPNATPASSFGVTGCGSSMPFKPGFDAGTVTPIAGGYSPFVLQLSRQDGEQDLSGLEATLPEGLLAKLAGVPECGEAEATKGTCPEASQIGTVSVTAGAGSEPLLQTGKIYLTSPYNHGPYGDVVVVPAIAGPFNLGDVIVRGSLRINPNTVQATIVSDPFPTVVDGVPVRVRSIDVEVNRPAFTFNPTNCDSQAVTATLTGTQGASATLTSGPGASAALPAVQGTSVTVSSPFAVTGCADLPFKPSFTASTRGKTSRVDGASLVVKVAQKAGEANIHRVHLAFPKALPARLATLRGACTEAQFAANPSGCPAGSVIGTGTAVTPVLSAPLSGPAYLVSHGGAAYPDVVFVLQGDGLTIDLAGATDIKKGIAYSTFETVPDAPVSSFETVLPEGPHAIFGANLPAKAKGSFCRRTPTIATTLEGQNGGKLTQSTKLKITGCPKKPKHAPKRKQKGGRHKR